MINCQKFQNTIDIQASATDVERCFTDLELMHRWLNPALCCEPIGDWSADLDSQSRFVINMPGWKPALYSRVVERSPGLVVWAFEGFFKGCDRWECFPIDGGARLLNCFEFEIPNPLVRFGFNVFAKKLVQQDMEAQLRRLRSVAERLTNRC